MRLARDAMDDLRCWSAGALDGVAERIRLQGGSMQS
jgi:hypothetical protein